MDPQRFDALIKALSLSAARRGMMTGFVSGAFAALVTNLETAARPHQNERKRHRDDRAADRLSEEKRKRHKKKKHKKKRKPTDQAPPCTEDSCPLPPGCSQQAFDDCGDALIEALQAEAEPCRPLCEGGDSPACQDCLEPIVRDRLSDIEACAVASCSSSARAAVARDWWVRQCDKPCCFRELQGCKEDAAEAYTLCLFGAVASCFSPAAPVCAFAIQGCLAMAMYSIAKCNARYGCAEYDACRTDNSCCPPGQTACEAKCCDLSKETCCGGGCCNEPDAQCCRSTGENPFFYCCPSNRTCCSTGGNQCCLS